PANTNLHGLVALLFACFGAGTPQFDSYPKNGGSQQIAPKPFVASLPQRLLSNQGKGALGVFGHVDLAWGFSIQPPGVTGAHVTPIRNCLARVLKGDCLGTTTRDLSDKAALLSTDLLDRVRNSSGGAEDQELVWDWIERNDAR